MSSQKAVKQEDQALEAIMAVQGIEQEDSLESLLAQEEVGEVDDILSALESDSEYVAQSTAEAEDKALDDLDLAEIRKKAYEEQSKAVKPDELNIEAAKESTGANVKPMREKRVVKRTSTASMSKSDVLMHKLGESRYEVCVFTEAEAALGEDERKELVDKFIANADRIPKKVGEKVVNLLSHVLNPAVPLSVYTKIALKELKVEKETSTEALRNLYLDKGYTIGTAGAQSSQMMTLFSELKIADRAGRSLTLRSDSILSQIIEQD